ncbi:DUF2272 domain-containing protein [Millisia brevis]|uniref:DUF2272 domain-containing protein n=1 Tax=Millisia brevis TaxID=264148 RepID=UPI00082F9902|nr:DUF2272 domain-containing protein [Millisia brevis]
MSITEERPAPELVAHPPAGTSLSAAVAHIAEAEYRRWHPGGGVRLVETDTAATPILQEYYRTGVGITVAADRLRSTQWQGAHPWSAVFVSWVMRRAGAGPSFAYSTAHQTYIRAARRNRLSGNTTNPFRAFRVGEVAPRVGDLVCKSRSGSGATYDTIGDRQRRATHCDIVTAVHPGRIRVIGGNVRQNVDAKTLRTGPDGLLRTDGNQAQYFAVIRVDGTPASTPPAPQSGAPVRASGSAAPASVYVVDHLPMLRGHAGSPPDLVLKWNAAPKNSAAAQATTVDVVVHLHGWSGREGRMNIVRDKLPVSGLDFADPKNPTAVTRTAPTLMVLPRGNHAPIGKKTARYTFPALVEPHALQRLIDESLRIFGAQTGRTAARRRLILTAHSGGGAALMRILEHTDPDEVYTFDALYTDPRPLIAWARSRRNRGGVLRVLYRPGEGTADNSRRVSDAVAGWNSPRFRVEQTTVKHDDIPPWFGWRLLADVRDPTSAK